MKLSTLACSLTLAFQLGSAWAQPNAYFRFPTIHGDRLVFTAEGDLWSASTQGGAAQRLTTHEGEEFSAAFSPDGQQIAFVASYAGSADVWVMPAQGGLPKRLSFAESRVQVLGWTPGGEVLYRAWAEQGPSALRVIRAVNPNTLAHRTLPLADVTDAAMDDAGKTLYVVRNGLWPSSGDNAKHYRGGEAASLWRYDLASGQEAVEIPLDAPAHRPMWWQGRLYVITDRDGTENIWSMKPDGTDLRQHTFHKDWDIRSASLEGGQIVYQLGADLHVLNIASGVDRIPDIQLTSDFRQTQPRVLSNPLKWLESARLSPDGERVAIVARGQAALAGLEQLRRVDLANAPGARIRQAVVSLDGKWVYAISNAGGEDQIWRFPADGSAGARALTKDAAGYRTQFVESPDGKWIAHQSKRGQTWLLNVANGENLHIDSSRSGEYGELVWSADSHTLVLVRPETAMGRRQIVLYSLADHSTHVLSSDKYESYAPSFSPDGKWLYFLSDRNFALKSESPWGDRNTGAVLDGRTKIYALALQAKNTFPFLPKTELDGADKKDAKGDQANKADKSDKAEKSKGLPAIEWSGLSERLYEVPVAAGTYTKLAATAERLLVLEQADHDPGTLKAVPVGNGGEPLKDVAPGVKDFQLSVDGKNLMLARAAKNAPPEFLILKSDVPSLPENPAKATVRLGDWSLRINPKAEWLGMFDDAWRMHKAYFFDQNMRGVDWDAMRKKYLPLAERATDRLELADALAQMTSELGAMHSQVGAGEVRTANDGGKPAFLGASFEKVANGYKVVHRYQSDPELPDERAPLVGAGVDVRDGDVIVAVNGQSAKASQDISELLVNQAGQQVLLEIQRGTAMHKAVVIPVGAERNANLRYADWEEATRQQVVKAGQGRIGYLHLRAMGTEDMARFVREFYANYNREGLVIDVRRNNGGNIDSWVIEKLLRRAWAFWTYRNSTDKEVNMQQTFRGHLVVLIDGHTYSDGETFAAGIKALGLAPLIGERTAGAGVWLSDGNQLVDGGIARAAENPQFDLKTGAWLVEGVGVKPDIEVLNPPHASFMGEDLQLKAALYWLDEKLKSDPVSVLKPEPIPPLVPGKTPAQ